MKIVRIIARLNIGGPARNAVLLSQSAKRKAQSQEAGCNWETVLVCGDVGKGEGDMTYLARERGVEPVIVPGLGRELSLWHDWRAFWRIYKIISTEKPDIVHTHTAKAGALGRMAGIAHSSWLMAHGLYKKRPLLVHTFHGHVLHSYFGKVKSLFFICIEKVLALFTDRIITVSKSLKDELVRKFRIAPEGKFSVVELGFELDELLRMPVKGDAETVNVGIVGRLTAVKNHRMFLRIAGKLMAYSSWPKGKIRFIIIGDGELREELEGYAGELGVEKMVEFRGWVKELKEIYGEMDIAALTSLNEGTPVSIIEAMAAGRPVVATDVGGVRDVVKHGKSGYLVEPGDEKGFAERMKELVNDTEKRTKFGERGRESVGGRFSKERLVEDTERVYREILEGKDIL